MDEEEQHRLENTCVATQSTFGMSAAQDGHDERHGVKSKHYLTVLRPEHATWMLQRLEEHVAGKVVVEIGAGIGVFALELARLAKHVYAIEADPAWAWIFTQHLYTHKPANLTFILDRAENLADLIRADVAVVVTGSDEDNLRQLAGRFAPKVFLPWQDWNDGIAVIPAGPRLWVSLGAEQRVCNCVVGGCALERGIDLPPGRSCTLAAVGARR